MREIKFRAWDKDNKKMLIPTSLHFICGQLDIVRTEEIVGITEEGVIFKKLIPIKNYTLMQYTGLKDKNGKDIWEGDILSVPAEGTWPEYKYIVDFWHGSFVAKETGSSGLNNYPNNFNFRASEVIGNIYENPELLTP